MRAVYSVICPFLFLLLIFLSGTHAVKAATKEESHVFDPLRLNEIQLEASEEVRRVFSGMRQEVLLELANTYFEHKNSSQRDIDPNIIEAYTLETIFDRIEYKLDQYYPDKIIKNSPWVWNHVGGISARLKILYCSLSEYIALFGTPLKQVGFSGEYHNMDVYDIMISGKMESLGAESTQSFPQTYYQGDISLLQKNESRIYNMDRNSYMIDYGRGQILLGFWSGVIAPYLFTNQDSRSLRGQVYTCAKEYLRKKN